MKIGFLGGSFDPIHLGHLLAAQDAVEQMSLDRLYFVPAAVPPLKERELIASPNDRLAMVRLALESDERFGVLTDELDRGGLSYTVESVRLFRRSFARDRLFWVIGGDQVVQLPQWHEVAELVQLTEFICLERPGHPLAPPPNLTGLRLRAVRSHRVEISSREIRERCRRGLPLRFFVPLNVGHYIESKMLYRNQA